MASPKKVRIDIHVGDPVFKERFLEALRRLGYKSVAEWFHEQARKTIAEAEGTPDSPIRLELAKKIEELKNKADKLKTKIGGEFQALKQIWVEVGGKLDLSNMEETIPKFYKACSDPVKATFFEEYAKLKKQIANLEKQLKKETEKIGF